MAQIIYACLVVHDFIEDRYWLERKKLMNKSSLCNFPRTQRGLPRKFYEPLNDAVEEASRENL